LKRSSTGVNCFLDTWTFFISSSWGDLLIPLFTGVLSHLGWILPVPFISLCIVTCFYSKHGMSIGKFLMSMSMGRRGWHLTAQVLSGDTDIMQHTHGLGTQAHSLMTINTQDDGGKACRLRHDWERGRRLRFLRRRGILFFLSLSV
jgi:hypothetical protein